MSQRKLAQLRELLRAMEVDLGIGDLSEIQRDVLYAVTLVADDEGYSSLQAIQGHELARKISRPSFFRALNALVKSNRIEHVGSERSGLYRRTDIAA